MKAKKKLKDYLTRGVRRLKHRKGFGVHSPFAYAIITEVIEEKLPYYAYQRMRSTYAKGKQTPVTQKVACLLFRLANRFRARRLLEVGCDGGYTLLPLMLFDSRAAIDTLADEAAHQHLLKHFHWVGAQHLGRVNAVASLDALATAEPYDMIVVGGLPEGMSAEALAKWLADHSHERTVVWLKGIRAGHRLEALWDILCDNDDIQISMDLYNHGLLIRRPHFFKQHYIVSF